MTVVDAPRPMITVVSAALIDAEGRLLYAQRPEGKKYAGWWEFPGGKIDPGESPQAALCRELYEELGITVAEHDLAPVIFNYHPYPDLEWRALVLVFAIRRWQGEMVGREGQAFRWDTIVNASAYQLLPTMLTALPDLQKYLAQ